jgi:hypothetical protein
MTWRTRDIGSQLFPVNAVNARTVTNTTVIDGVAINGRVIDRRGDGSDVNDLYLSAKVVIPFDATLVSTGTATLALKLQHSATTVSGAFVDYDAKDGSTVTNSTLSGSTVSGSTAQRGVLTQDFDLSSANRYVRVELTPSFSHTTASSVTDEDFDFGGVVVLGGADVNPAS